MSNKKQTSIGELWLSNIEIAQKLLLSSRIRSAARRDLKTQWKWGVIKWKYYLFNCNCLFHQLSQRSTIAKNAELETKMVDLQETATENSWHNLPSTKVSSFRQQFWHSIAEIFSLFYTLDASSVTTLSIKNVISKS